MRVTNWGMFLLGIYLIIVGLNSFSFFTFGFGQLVGLLALVAGILILMDNWRR